MPKTQPTPESASPPDAAPTARHVLRGLAKIALEVSKIGIQKGKERTGSGGYWYRGIDDVTWVMSGLFADNEILCVPSYANSRFETRKTKTSEWYIAHTEGSFVFTSLRDGSTLAGGPMPGEAGDSGDKAMSKACSISLRNFLLQTFLAPVGPEMDTESTGMNVDENENQDAAAPAVKPSPRRVEGEVAGGELAQGQIKIRDARLKQKGLSLEQATEAFGVIDKSSMNRFLEWIAAQ